MEAIRGSQLPRKISQLYADTKKSYENVVQNNSRSQQISGTHLRLRIQKDRLIAWGLEWADSQSNEDIDGSLDRAGISDLVASIMSSIRQLLEEADRIQLHRNTSFPGALGHSKTYSTGTKESLKVSPDPGRLEDVVKDLTASIDILCDLSRSRQVLRQKPEIPAKPVNVSPTGIREQLTRPKSHFSEGNFDNIARALPTLDETVSGTSIDASQLRLLANDTTPIATASPPPYESVAASSEDRVLAFFRKPSEDRNRVLLDYVPALDAAWAEGLLPSASRYGELLEAQSSSGVDESLYKGILSLRGWVMDAQRSRAALVYEIPRFCFSFSAESAQSFEAHSLLSYLQHAADTDSTNMPSLEDRFRLAFNLSSTMLHLHAKGLLHRNVNSNNILFFEDSPTASSERKPWKSGIIRRPFLTSFDQLSRDVDDEREEPFISNIYRHPQIERSRRTAFRKGHDIYSLGLILLEVGLWMPITKLWKTRYTRADFKSRLQTVYTRKLIAKCGSGYTRVVEYCLRAADEAHLVDNSLKQPLSENRRAELFQTNFYWRVFKILERCCMIDEVETSVVPSLDHINPTTEEVQQAAPHENESRSAPTEDPEAQGLQTDRERLVQGRKATSESPSPQPQPQQKSKKFTVWSYEIPAVVEAHWHQHLAPKLNRMFSHLDRWESYSIETFMAGETAEMAKPTIYMVCNSVEKARKVLQYVNKDQGFFDIKVTRGQIMRSKAGKKRRQAKKRRKTLKSPGAKGFSQIEGNHIQFRYYQERPTCGASIGAYLDEEHLPPVSFGGTVLVDGEPYGMSVHHMLENDELDMGLDDAFDLQRSMAPRMRVEDDEVRESLGDCYERIPEALYPFELSEDEEDDEGYLSLVENGDDENFDPVRWDKVEFSPADDVDMGDTLGIDPGRGEHLIVTQPAIDDVDEGFFPNEEDMDEDHLSSHTLGHIHASSGIRRTSRGTISHEVDWALIKIQEKRRNHANLIKSTSQDGGTNAEDDRPYPCDVIPTEDLGGLKVHAVGRTSGYQSGIILPRMIMVKMPGRISSSHSWQVMGNFGAGGDSGAWVIDDKTGHVCAHVLAWSQRSNTAYIAPMEVLLDDMAQRLDAKISLPSQTLSAPNSPPMATSPPRQISSLSMSETVLQPTSATHQNVLESKRRSGREMLMEKSEEGVKAGYRLGME
ncbi:MAG: hypothetical protein Q9190_007198 [Brigantiaea leucoxantha]